MKARSIKQSTVTRVVSGRTFTLKCFSDGVQRHERVAVDDVDVGCIWTDRHSSTVKYRVGNSDTRTERKAGNTDKAFRAIRDYMVAGVLSNGYTT